MLTASHLLSFDYATVDFVLFAVSHKPAQLRTRCTQTKQGEQSRPGNRNTLSGNLQIGDVDRPQWRNREGAGSRCTKGQVDDLLSEIRMRIELIRVEGQRDHGYVVARAQVRRDAVIL